MTKLVFVACVNLNDKYSGITRKVISQFNVLRCDFEAYLIGYEGKKVRIIDNNSDQVIEPQNGRHRRLAVMDETLKLVQEYDIQNVYIRRMPLNPMVYNFLKKLKRKGRKILWEIPTYPYDYEPKTSFMAKLSILLDKFYRRKLKTNINKIVTFSNEQIIFGCSTINTGNGIDVANVRERLVDNHGDQVHFFLQLPS